MAALSILLLCLTAEAGSPPAYGSQTALVSHLGQTAVIPEWRLTSSANASSDAASLSQPGIDTSSWYRITSRSTVMHGLIQAGVYEVDDLFYSDDLNDQIDYSHFSVPWLYQYEYGLHPANGSHFFLNTNGITSKADIYVNGKQIAAKRLQSGAYGGHSYDITALVAEQNGLLIRAYPTDYDYDFALGFVDWNPYPPDNGTGIWRDIEIKQTGSVYMGPLRVLTDWTPGSSSATVTLKADVKNLESRIVNAQVEGTVTAPNGTKLTSLAGQLRVGAGQTQTVTLSTTVLNAEIWWPRQWGSQPLYAAQLFAFVANELSDRSSVTQFGIRHIVSEVNEHNDTIFTLNGNTFQVRGGGYGPDMFLRWDSAKFETQANYVLDMGMNTIRLEGKLEHPELYAIADRLGLMVMPGWECCDKWEAWTYNDELDVDAVWDNADYATANTSMRHEASMLQTHPSLLAFLVGSDFYPNDRAAAIYVDALHDADWQVPVICSAAKLGYPEILGPSGMKMDGPYDWVPPNYWYDEQLGAAFGFGSELGAGVGTPELGSLVKFLTKSDLNDLWKHPNKGLYHMSTNVSSFYTRQIYNDALWSRYGTPTSLEDYLLKAQMMDYEATRAEYEGYSAKWNAERPATGLIYWMLNNAWPSLHWNQFDYYLHPGGSYFGTKVGNRAEHVAYDYKAGIWLINHSLDEGGARNIKVDLISLDGKTLATSTINAQTTPNTSKKIGTVPGYSKLKSMALLKIVLDDGSSSLSRNVYWITNTIDKLDWDNSTWYYTPVTDYVDYTPLDTLMSARVFANVAQARSGSHSTTLTLRNEGEVPAVFIRLNLVDGSGSDVVPVFWSENYLTLWPNETMQVSVSWPGDVSGVQVVMNGKNVASQDIAVI